MKEIVAKLPYPLKGKAWEIEAKVNIVNEIILLTEISPLSSRRGLG